MRPVDRIHLVFDVPGSPGTRLRLLRALTGPSPGLVRGPGAGSAADSNGHCQRDFHFRLAIIGQRAATGSGLARQLLPVYCIGCHRVSEGVFLSGK
ncbi:hypothetical protein D3C76_659880 [compost metagenome]